MVGQSIDCWIPGSSGRIEEGPSPFHPDRLRWGGASTPPPKDRVALGTSGPTPPEARVEPQERRATTIVVEGGMQERGRPPPSTARVEHQQCRVKAIAVEKRGPMPARGWNRAQGIPGDDNRGRGRIAGGIGGHPQARSGSSTRNAGGGQRGRESLQVMRRPIIAAGKIGTARDQRHVHPVAHDRERRCPALRRDRTGRPASRELTKA